MQQHAKPGNITIYTTTVAGLKHGQVCEPRKYYADLETHVGRAMHVPERQIGHDISTHTITTTTPLLPGGFTLKNNPVEQQCQ